LWSVTTIKGTYLKMAEAPVARPTIPPTPNSTALLAAVVITAVVDETKDETMEMVENTYPTLIPIPCAASLNAAMSARIAELDHTQAARNHVLQQAAELRESLRLQDEARKGWRRLLGFERSQLCLFYIAGSRTSWKGPSRCCSMRS